MSYGWFQSFQNIDQWFSNWLYGPYDEQKYKTAVFLYGVPFVGDYMDYLLDVRAGKEYLERHGMDYSDIHDFRKLSGSDSGARLSGSVLNYVSRNLTRLYR